MMPPSVSNAVHTMMTSAAPSVVSGRSHHTSTNPIRNPAVLAHTGGFMAFPHGNTPTLQAVLRKPAALASRDLFLGNVLGTRLIGQTQRLQFPVQGAAFHADEGGGAADIAGKTPDLRA